MQQIVQIVPFRRADPDGVGDYAVMIANALHKHYGTKTSFVSSTPMDKDGTPNDQWPTHYLEKKSANHLDSALKKICGDNALIILHMSTYGYQKRGVPLWLIPGVKQFLKSRPKVKTVSVFHELYARSKPTNSAFWLGWLQKRIVQQALGLSTAALTPCQSYHDELQFWSRASKPIVAMPVFSNVGEPMRILTQSKREKNLVIFGRGHSRAILYQEYITELEKLVNAWGVKKIVDIGSPNSSVPPKVGNCKVRSTGILTADEISAQLLTSEFAAFSYDALRLGKSTIFAAYAAHGLKTICFDKNNITSDGLKNGHHLIIAPPITPENETTDNIANHAFDWYNQHNSAVQAKTINKLLKTP